MIEDSVDAFPAEGVAARSSEGVKEEGIADLTVKFLPG